MLQINSIYLGLRKAVNYIPADKQSFKLNRTEQHYDNVNLDSLCRVICAM